jgi:predicted RNase H-like HicB family nuclease
MEQAIMAREYRYTAVFNPAEEGGFVVTFPTLRGLITEGDNLEHARAMAAEALHGYLERLAKDGLPAPAEDPQPSMPLVRETVTAAF